MAMRGGWSLFLAVLLFGAGSAVAQTAPNLAVEAACRADIQRLCAGVQPGGDRIRQCMRAHVREVSPGCIAAARAARGAR